jgi:hypothetical protein
VFVTTLKPGGTGYNPTGINLPVITKNFWVLNQNQQENA